MGLQQEYLKDKHCIQVSSEKAKALVIVHMDKQSEEAFFDFCFDRGYKVEILDLERYINIARITPKWKNDASDIVIRSWHDKTKVPVRLMFDGESPFKLALDFWLHHVMKQ